MTGDANATYAVRIHADDRPFLDDECLRMMQDAFARTRKLARPSLADVVSELLEELRRRRREAASCTCGACTPPDEDPADQPTLI